MGGGLFIAQARCGSCACGPIQPNYRYINRLPLHHKIVIRYRHDLLRKSPVNLSSARRLGQGLSECDLFSWFLRCVRVCTKRGDVPPPPGCEYRIARCGKTFIILGISFGISNLVSTDLGNLSRGDKSSHLAHGTDAMSIIKLSLIWGWVIATFFEPRTRILKDPSQ